MNNGAVDVSRLGLPDMNRNRSPWACHACTEREDETITKMAIIIAGCA